MKITKKETVSAVIMIDKIHNVLSDNAMKDAEFVKLVPVVAKICIKLHPLYHNDVHFMALFNYVIQLLATFKSVPIVPISKSMDNKRRKLLSLLEQFELLQFKDVRFHIYLYNCTIGDLPINGKYVHSITSLPSNTKIPVSILQFQESKSDFSVLIHSGQLSKNDTAYANFCFLLEEIMDSMNVVISDLKNLDYYMRDRLYLEAKLESLKKRSDIRLLLAGSSYTMCGLFEEQMPLPARNVAIDAQDLYYTLKTIRTALTYNPNITHCIISFAYYFWGYDLSLSTSIYQYKRVTEVNYPVFKDKHNFSGDPIGETQTFLTSITPLKKSLFSFETWAGQYIDIIKNNLADSHYFPYPREDSEVLKHDDVTNREKALERAESHNKFFKYTSTVKENQKLFADFLKEMNNYGIKILLYVPPVTEFYRNSINPCLISDFYACMEPLKANYHFKLIDLFNSDAFENTDFADYDHLNDLGARKLAEILVHELEF
ncbi:hypothetical protein [Heyndrickxia ginsengihumi]|uniref:hypothetical protein n=1 Tax=Heyndrickxia ginsengihumi TaxID=363870 RepID=UPI0004702430|nr:hypothetical protein [Heyndrickxia ginsengihumi]